MKSGQWSVVSKYQSMFAIRFLLFAFRFSF
jgi:hypothetical protein